MKDDPFHQIVSVDIELKKAYSAGGINRILKEFGAKLHYDVYSFERIDKGPIWQSESYIYVALFYKGKEVDAQETSDRIELQYPLATIGSEYISKFAEIVTNLASFFNSNPKLDSTIVDKKGLVSHCDELVTELITEWGEEPGSETLKILIESNYT